MYKRSDFLIDLGGSMVVAYIIVTGIVFYSRHGIGATVYMSAIIIIGVFFIRAGVRRKIKHG